MRYFLFFLILLLHFTADSQPVNDSLALHTLIEKEWDFRQQEFPYLAGDTGGKPGFPDISLEGYQRRSEFWEAVLEDLERIDKDRLSAEDQINYSIFAYQLKNKVALIAFGEHLMPINAEGGFYTSLGMIPGNTSFATAAHYERYLGTLQLIDKYMDDQITLMRTGIEKGITQPRIIVANHRVLIKPYLVSAADASIFYTPFQQMPSRISADEKRALRRQASAIIEQEVIPAYKRLATFLEEEYLPAARETIGAVSLPDGEAYYQQRVAYFSTMPLTADEIYHTGLTEVARIRSEMEAIIRDTGFGGDFAEFLDFLRTDPQFYVDTPEQLLKEAAYIAKTMDGKLPQYFNTLPRLPYGIEPVPAAIAPTYTSGRYSGGSWENHQAGMYWVNTYNLGSRTLYTLPALTLHEAVPGHHLQIALSREIEDLPEFRQHSYISAFGEGWGLYAEYLGVEAGMYKTPYEHFGRLTYEMWRACRLVIDVGIHAKGWSREKALDYLASNTALSLHEVNTEIDRYIGWPGQALSYKMGELKIKALRKMAEEALGSKFNIRHFHDAVLMNGSVPLFVLEEVIRKYIEEAKTEKRMGR